jgi:hypothetical protein
MISPKYQILIDILDKLRQELKPADASFSKYNPDFSDTEKVNQARARAYIHLFLKVSFGLLEFKDREHFITDGSYDGGIDGYFINKDNKTIYFIQSKFRINEKNFENKKIALDEVLVMDINRILDGETKDELGNPYNGKIQQLQRDIREIDNIARYSYKVIILANLRGWTDNKLRQLTGGFATEVFDYEKSYEKLIFPIISGTFYNASELNINIDLSNKNAGSKISYTVLTKKGECEITVLFVPTIEIGRIMNKYKNSVLKYNPRSYLDLEGKKVNTSITETIINKDTNEFALFNNGITMLSDETLINEKIGQKNKAQLIVKNPQIINGGQTSYTLSRIYQTHKDTDVEHVFQNKEVLLKIITLLDKNDERSKIELIEEISTATNQQTPVIGADRFANDAIHVEIQKVIFDRYGLLYERKRGEFADGLFNNYINDKQIIERNLFFRVYFSSNGNVEKGKQKKLFLKQNFTSNTLNETDKLDNAYFGYLCFKKLYKAKHPNQAVDKITYAKVRALTLLYKPEKVEDYQAQIDSKIELFEAKWKSLITTVSNNPRYDLYYKDKKTGEDKIRNTFDASKYFDSTEFESDLRDYYK